MVLYKYYLVLYCITLGSSASCFDLYLLYHNIITKSLDSLSQKCNVHVYVLYAT